MATRVFDGIKFCEKKNIQRASPGTFMPSLVQIGPAVWEEKDVYKETGDETQRTTDTAPP